MLINNASDLTRALREGPYAWPGGYPIMWIMTDGETMCAVCAKKNRALMRVALRDRDRRSDWHPAGIDIHWEGPAYFCAHCNGAIESAYGDPDAPETEG